MTLRQVEMSDIPALAALEEACFPDPWDEGSLKLLGRAPYGGLCAMQDGKLVGYVGWMYMPAGDGMPAEAEITRIAVSPDARRQGIGRTLLGGMLDTLHPAGEPMHIFLDVRASNTPAKGLYEAFGFRRCGRRPRFYGDEDALEYLLEL